MVSRSNSRWLVILLVGLGTAPVAAQAPGPSAPLRLSFADAVNLAAAKTPVVELATLRTSEADARVRQARAALLPSLSGSGVWLNRSFNSRSIGISFPGVPELIGPFNNYDARLNAAQTLFDWSSVARVRAAGAQADGSRAERGVTVEGSVLTTALAYVRAVRAQSVVAARQADSVIAAELVGLAEAQRAAGVSPAIDVTRARAQLATAEGLLLVARNQLDRGRIDVARALGLDAATPLAFTDSLAPSLGAADVPAQRDSVVTAALTNRPELRAELARAAAARQTGSARIADPVCRAAAARASSARNSGRLVSAAVTTESRCAGTSAAPSDGASESVKASGVAASRPRARATSMRPRSSWFRATSSKPSAVASCARARVTSIAGLTPAARCASARPTSSAAMTESACRAATTDCARTART